MSDVGNTTLTANNTVHSTLLYGNVHQKEWLKTLRRGDIVQAGKLVGAIRYLGPINDGDGAKFSMFYFYLKKKHMNTFAYGCIYSLIPWAIFVKKKKKKEGNNGRKCRGENYGILIPAEKIGKKISSYEMLKKVTGLYEEYQKLQTLCWQYKKAIDESSAREQVYKEQISNLTQVILGQWNKNSTNNNIMSGGNTNNGNTHTNTSSVMSPNQLIKMTYDDTVHHNHGHKHSHNHNYTSNSNLNPNANPTSNSSTTTTTNNTTTPQPSNLSTSFLGGYSDASIAANGNDNVNVNVNVNVSDNGDAIGVSNGTGGSVSNGVYHHSQDSDKHYTRRIRPQEPMTRSSDPRRSDTNDHDDHDEDHFEATRPRSQTHDHYGAKSNPNLF
ncbi:hypothetical protein RFI_06169 [Reticulomyxa filosa]|uniref:Uncharacterized protein n=1 Tax=Reticulomyxa filosa TaxID=46433 RepID=X6NXC2_RETFI|nr:hypothetical protein RFI_06169 [Reticulomyxa filosa]|eukprot:ETO30950.1 hypothetical protein RFI_06169 [Reticulomyxa filosa]